MTPLVDFFQVQSFNFVYHGSPIVGIASSLSSVVCLRPKESIDNFSTRNLAENEHGADADAEACQGAFQAAAGAERPRRSLQTQGQERHQGRCKARGAQRILHQLRPGFIFCLVKQFIHVFWFLSGVQKAECSRGQSGN
jgi:hypothetical protein